MNKHRIPIQIRFNDVDMVGHINNVIFGHYCDMGRYNYMQEVMTQKPDLLLDNKVLILVHTEFDYLHPCFIHDQLFLDTALEKTGERSVHMIQEIVDAQGQVRVRSRSVMSTFDKTTGKSFPLPECWKNME